MVINLTTGTHWVTKLTRREEVSWGEGVGVGGCGSGEEGDSTKAKIESHNYQFSYNIIIHNGDGLKLYSYTQLYKLVGPSPVS